MARWEGDPRRDELRQRKHKLSDIIGVLVDSDPDTTVKSVWSGPPDKPIVLTINVTLRSWVAGYGKEW
jgi:hypothetical protein